MIDTGNAEWDSAMSHPYRVILMDATWTVMKVVGFQSEAESRAFARNRPEPVIYLEQKRPTDMFVEVLGFRVLTAHPNPPEGYTSIIRDDFPQEGAPLCFVCGMWDGTTRAVGHTGKHGR